MGRVELDLYDVAVDCDDITESCHDRTTGLAVAPEPLRSWVFASTETSQYDPDGFYVYFEVAREPDRIAHIELDIPREGQYRQISFSYVEYEGATVVFRSTHAQGALQVPIDALGEDCDCADTRLEMTFIDPGEDERLGTEDDRTRHLSRARFGWRDDFCVARRMLATPADVVEVDIVDRCPSRTVPSRSDPQPVPPTTRHYSSSDCQPEHETYRHESSSCSNDSSCEGDSSDSSCDGDTSGSSCDGDVDDCAVAQPRQPAIVVSSNRARRENVPWISSGRVQLVLLVALALVLGRRRNQ